MGSSFRVQGLEFTVEIKGLENERTGRFTT